MMIFVSKGISNPALIPLYKRICLNQYIAEHRCPDDAVLTFIHNDIATVARKNDNLHRIVVIAGKECRNALKFLFQCICIQLLEKLSLLFQR